MRMPTVMGHKFSQVPQAKIERSSFDRSHGYKTTFDAGHLIPFYVDEGLPGDTFNCRVSAFARLATPLKPIMDNMYLDTFFFAVPIRLLWDHWEEFNGAQKDPDDSVDFVIPTLAEGAYVAGSLEDYFGLPLGFATALTPSAFWHRAYNLIWNEWFRDQNIQDSVPILTGDGPDALSNYQLLRRGKRHDYFTSALPWPQKGDSVSISLGMSAPVVSAGDGFPQFGGDYGGGPGNTVPTHLRELSGSANIVGSQVGVDSGVLNWYATKLEADLSSATPVTINELRQAFQIQKLLERDARGGTRYTEVIRSHFGVTSPDARLQRPEYLGGGSSPVVVSPIAQTSEDGTTPQGNLAAIGTVSVHGHGFVKSFTEHVILMGLCSVRADLTYQYGLDRMWSRQTRYDFYWPALSHIGEQAVLAKEIYFAGNAGDDVVFGYQERYAEYRYKPSKVTGLFRSLHPQTLDVWHLAQEYGAAPTLSAQFIQEDPPIDRVIAVNTEPHFIFDSYIRLKCARPLPVYGVPGLIDHF